MDTPQSVLDDVDGKKILPKDSGKGVEINNPVLDSVRTGSALKLDAQHAFNNIIDNYASSAHKHYIKYPEERENISRLAYVPTDVPIWVLKLMHEDGYDVRTFTKDGDELISASYIAVREAEEAEPSIVNTLEQMGDELRVAANIAFDFVPFIGGFFEK